MKTMVPPGGFAGYSQMTQASQTALRRGAGARGTYKGRVNRGPKKRRSKRSGSAKRKRSTTAKKAKRMVKGSAAARAYMAKLRRMRKK